MVQVGINSLQDADSALSMGLSLASVALVFLFGHRQLVEGMMATPPGSVEPSEKRRIIFAPRAGFQIDRHFPHEAIQEEKT